jgi:hypothetical protein
MGFANRSATVSSHGRATIRSGGDSDTMRRDVERRQFLTSLFGGVAATPLGVRTERKEADATSGERDAATQFGTALQGLTVENERLRAQIARGNEDLASANEYIMRVQWLVHRVNCEMTSVIMAADIIQHGLSDEPRADAKRIVDARRRIAPLIHEVFERARSRRLAASA